MDPERGLTGITIYVTRESYYNPEKDEAYTNVNDFINIKLAKYPERFIIRCTLCIEGLEPYKIVRNKDRG